MRPLQRWLQIVLMTLPVVVGCATAPPAPPSVNVSGAWAGTFEGKALGIIRTGAAEAEFTQTDAEGTGRMRFAYGPGERFQPVKIAVAGNRLIAEHAAGARYLTVEFSVEGDTMSGKITSSGVPVNVTLKRVR